MKTQRHLIAPATLALVAGTAAAQWNPSAGQWLKSDPADIRVMTWNIGDGLFANQGGKQSDSFSNWNAVTRIVAALEPDVLILQEVGASGGADSVNVTNQVIDLWRNGGADPFIGGTVTSFITGLALTPGYDLPYRYVLNQNSDGFNRNVILSRFPIADINGDGVSVGDDISVQSDLWAPGPDGGIRGFSFAEIDLPDTTYSGDMVIGNSHLKAFGDCNSYQQRVRAAQNISYFIEHYWNGDQTGTSDPRGRINFPNSGSVLDANTPVVWGGDWNNTPTFDGPGGCTTSINPVEYMVSSAFGLNDGTDRDGSDAQRDFALVPGTSDASTQSGSKLDYIAWQDSIATLRREFIFNAGRTPFPLPQPVATGPRPTSLSGIASDHRPVIVDLILPLQAQTGAPIFSGFLADPGTVSFNETLTLTASVFDPDGSVVGDVEFVEDSNLDGQLDAMDQTIGFVTPSNPSGQSDAVFSAAPSSYMSQASFDQSLGSTRRFFAIASDGINPASVTQVDVAFVNDAPNVSAISASQLSVGYNDSSQISVSASDSDGTISSFELRLNDNPDGQFGDRDTLIASGPTGSPASSIDIAFSPSDVLTPAEFVDLLGPGRTVFAAAIDDRGEGAISTINFTFVNSGPTLNLSANPEPAAPGESVVVSATASDLEGSVASVAFVIDDGDGVYEFPGDEFLGLSFSPPYQATVSAAQLSGAPLTVLVQALDDQNAQTIESIVLTVEDVQDCAADLDGNGFASQNDVTLFVNAFFANDLAADLTGEGTVSQADVQAFVDAFFAPECQQQS